MKGKFELFKSEKNGQFYFRLYASNGEIILRSEGYTTKANCKKGILSVRKNSVSDRAFCVNPKFFNIKSVANGKIIGTSEQYSSAQARDKGIASVKANAAEAEFVDLTMS